MTAKFRGKYIHNDLSNSDSTAELTHKSDLGDQVHHPPAFS